MRWKKTFMMTEARRAGEVGRAAIGGAPDAPGCGWIPAPAKQLGFF